jgi:ribosomal protein S30
MYLLVADPEISKGGRPPPPKKQKKNYVSRVSNLEFYQHFMMNFRRKKGGGAAPWTPPSKSAIVNYTLVLNAFLQVFQRLIHVVVTNIRTCGYEYLINDSPRETSCANCVGVTVSRALSGFDYIFIYKIR